MQPVADEGKHGMANNNRPQIDERKAINYIILIASSIFHLLADGDGGGKAAFRPVWRVHLSACVCVAGGNRNFPPRRVSFY